jgi:hypothetical protein
MSYIVVKLSDTLVRYYQHDDEDVWLQDKENPHLLCRICKRSKTFYLNYSERGRRKNKKIGRALLHTVKGMRKKAYKLLLRSSDGFGADYDTINDIIDGPYMTNMKLRMTNTKPELSKLEKHIRPYSLA